MTIEELELKNWLNRAFHADKKVKALEIEIEQCREFAQRISTRCGCSDKGKSSGSENGTESALMRLADTEIKLSRKIIELLDIKDEISDVIAMLQDDDLEAVLIYRYLLYKTIEETAELMNYDPRTVRRKQSEAIRKLVLKCPILS